MGINTRNWVDSIQDRDYWRALVNCSIEPQVSISQGVSYTKDNNPLREWPPSRENKNIIHSVWG